ncbi:MAG: DUF1559 domain-containing protein, partial [Thermoguttaceae bacterium]|nr:DUF1559 domain-containing protein [Thermoguttaceae bacterium]
HGDLVHGGNANDYCHGMWGWAAFILPQIEEAATYSLIDFSYPAYCHNDDWSPSASCGTCEWSGDTWCANHQEVAESCPAILQCPSSDHLNPNRTKDYAVNGATSDGAYLPERTNNKDRFVGLFGKNVTFNIANIKDGTSHTILAAELCTSALPNQVSDTSNTGANPFVWVNDLSQGYFILGQNNKPICVPNCLTYNRTERCAKSQHPGGLNAVMADGSVHFVSDVVNVDVWASSMTRQRNKTITITGTVYGGGNKTVENETL